MRHFKSTTSFKAPTVTVRPCQTGVIRHNAANVGEKTGKWKDGSVMGLAHDRDHGKVMLATTEAPPYKVVYELTSAAATLRFDGKSSGTLAAAPPARAR